MNEQTLQILIQGGAVAINLAMLVLFYKIAVMFNATEKERAITDREQRAAANEANITLAQSLSKLADRVEHCPHNRTGTSHAARA